MKKIKIFLAGDSTMQSYSQLKRPQYGWGELFYKYIDNNLLQEYHRENSEFENQKCYETKNFIIDNCAMAGRSLKSFTDERRHIDLFNNIDEGDYLLMQFGHNDIAKDKLERYIPLEQLENYCNIFINEAKVKKFNLIILSPILIDIYSDNNYKLQEMVNDLKIYISEMEKIAIKNKIPFINVGLLAKKALEISNIIIDSLYLEDHVHLAKKGANFYADIISLEVKKII